jgi:hypothetical protein
MWIVQKLREAFPSKLAPRFLIFDRDAKYGLEVPTACSISEDDRASDPQGYLTMDATATLA